MRLWMASLTWCIAVGCSGGAPAKRRVPEVATARAETTAAPTAPPAADASRLDVAEPPPRAQASTPGKIACGGSTCDATHELCCDNARCVDLGDVEAFVAANASDDEARRTLGRGCPLDGEWKRDVAACDDAGDCAGGAGCCEGGRATEFVSTSCRDTPCFQVCSGPGGCTPGYHCELEPDPTGIVKGYCRFSAAVVTCGDETCRDDKPICCDPIDAEGDDEGGAHCVASSGACEGGGRRRECRRRADCGDGRQCCAVNMGESMCMPRCSTGLGDLIVCETIADCPPIDGRAPKTCSGDALLKWCDYPPL